MPECTVCSSSDVAAIDHALLSGESTRKIEKKFGVGRASLSRHRRHISPAKVEVIAAVESAEASIAKSKLPALEQLRLALAGQWQTIERAANAGNLGVATQGYKNLIESIQKLGEQTGDFKKDSPTIAVMISGFDQLLQDYRTRAAEGRRAQTIDVLPVIAAGKESA